MLTHQNISGNEELTEASIETVPYSILPSAPSATPPPSQFRTSPSDSPLDNEAMIPYKRQHHSPRDSPISNRPKEPRTPLSLLTLDSSYTQPSNEHPNLTRNYSGKRSRPESVITNTSSAEDERLLQPNTSNSRSVSPRFSDDRVAADTKTAPGSGSSHYPTFANDNNGGSDDDDMTIMRPGRKKPQLFDGYKERNRSMSNFDPGEDTNKTKFSS